jgi:hypothetical protein
MNPMIIWQIVVMIASIVISYALQPKPLQPKAATADDFNLPTTEDGTPKVVVFGDVWLTSWCVIGVGNYRNQAIIKKQSGLFGSKKTTTGYRYFMSLHMGICLGLDDLVEIKVSDKTAWKGTVSSANRSTISINQPNLFGGDEAEGGIQGSMIIMRGAVDQPALEELEMMYGTIIQEGYYKKTGAEPPGSPGIWIPPIIEPAVVPAYRGCVTFFYDGLICSNSPYPKPWSFRVRRTTSNWDDTTWYPEKATIWLSDNQIKAMNAAHIIYEAQTNRVWGRGFASSQIDGASFKAAADQLYTEGFGLCLAWRRQDSIQAFIQEVLDHIGAAMFVDRMTGLWRLDLIRDNYNVATLPSFNFSTGLLRVEEDNNASNDLVTNQTIISYIDPITNESRPARAENLAAIQRNGIILENKSYNGLPTIDIAGRVAARDMKIAQSGLKRFKLVFDRRAFNIQPMSVFKLELPERGISSIVVRAIRVDHDTVTNGEITVSALQDVFGLPATNFIQDQPSLWQPPNLDPVQITIVKLFEIPYAQLLENFTVEDIGRMTNQSYLMPLARKPNTLQQDFNILAKTLSDSAYVDVGEGQYIFNAPLAEPMPVGTSSVLVTLTQTIDESIVSIGQCVLIDDEIFRVDAVLNTGNQVMLARGCIDTVPKAHSLNTTVWFYGDVATAAERSFTAGQAVNLKLLSRTTNGEFSEVSGNVLSITGQNRIARPYPPANVLLNDLSYPATLSTLTKVSWRYRNRVTQGTTIMDQVAAASALESGVTYSIKLYKKTSTGGSFTQIAEKSGLTDSTVYINPAPEQTGTTLTADFSSAIAIRVELYAVLNSLESLQKHVIDVDIVA